MTLLASSLGFSSTRREKQTLVTDMDGTLLRGRSSFPYFALVAFEVGGVLRLLFLLLASPLAGLLYYFILESAGIRVLIFATFAGMKVADIESVARAVPPKFYSSDLHPEAWRVFSSCGRRCVLTANPRVMAEAFLKDYLGADMVLGTEIGVYKGSATGLVCAPGIVVGKNKAMALNKAFSDTCMPEIGLGDRKTDAPFMKLCKNCFKTLHLRSVTGLAEDIVPALFSDFKFLECLKLEKCIGLRCLEINAGGSLKSLTVVDCPDLAEITLSASNLKSFSYQGVLPRIQLKNGVNLVDVMLDMRAVIGHNEFDCEELLSLLAALKDVQILTLSGWLLEF
ncbi:glycerol-3-phosphate acyltransferase RAM2-like [Cornus florida]|uniref:glycerol-3-phosphate acyltransferase RAM2-like n=1 Tax=Cornus florida TaxID=4283 RepID=UPI002899AFED|nr:glycerol-3-phosphate acyltransferase RAM2-like [Cornus florida]